MLPFSLLAALSFLVPYYLLGTFLGPEFASIVGAIAGMFDTAFGVVANFTAGDNEATTTDMTVSFLRGVDFGMELHLKVFIVKAGRSLIRQRAELTDAATGKLLATASGSWMPL